MDQFDLDKTLIQFQSPSGASDWTIRDAVEGVQIFGGIGSGKTSGSGRTLALKFLANGFGGLVLTAKPGEKDLWESYCRQTNRTDDLIVIEPGGPHRFNFLEYESGAKDSGISLTANLVEVLKTVIRAGEDKSSGKSDDQFWETSLDMLIHNVLDLCLLAYGKVSVQQLFDVASTAPKKGDPESINKKVNGKRTAFSKAFEAARNRVKAQIGEWETTLTAQQKVRLSEADAFEESILERFPDARLLSSIDQFFIENYQNLSERTRSIIEFIFTGFLFHLLKEPVYSLFCRYESTITPEACLEGKIILVNLPIKKYHKVGRDCQILFKYVWQRAMEKREIEWNDRPQFLWADEAQNFLHEHDAAYQATARSSRIATVYLSQNLPNYFANMGGSGSEHRVKSFIGTLGTKIFHANADWDTNEFASKLIGSAHFEDLSRNVTLTGSLVTGETSALRLEQMVRPEQFSALKTGGPRNHYAVEAYIHKQGNAFASSLNFQRVFFNQQ